MNARASHPLPDDALDDRLGFIGTSGSGKTYNAGSAVERILDRGARVVIIDPLGVWWGLRLLADGRTPSPHDAVIFGGPRGDLALSDHVGALIGETAATMAESCILDLSQLGSKAAERRFMLAFLDAIYRKAGGEPFHLVVDEADLFAPQKPQKGDEALLGMMENIVRRGRIKGFIPWLISQRPAVLNKNVLSQVDGLVAFKLTATQDRDALDDWIEGQADKAQGREIKASLPTLPIGTGVVWLPGRAVLKTAPFPAKLTYDSSRTPKRGEKVKRAAALKSIDLGALKERLASVENEAKENDPKALKAEIARLKREMGKPTVAPVVSPAIDQDSLDEAYGEGHTAGFMEGQKSALDKLAPWRAKANLIRSEAKDMAEGLDAIFAATPAPTKKPAGVAQRPEHRPSKPVMTGSSPAVRSNPAAGPGEKMSGAERKILTALAQYPDGRSKRQVAILTGYAATGGGFNNAMSSLRTKGWMDGRGDPLRITDAGLAALGSYEPLPTGRDLLEHWLGQLSKAERAILVELYRAYPDALSKEQVGNLTSYEPNGGGFNNALSRLRTLELIDGRGELRASEDLFP